MVKLTEKQKKTNSFLRKVARIEKKKTQVTIGNLREVLKTMDTILDGKLYKLIEKSESL